jgi:hypothetical protein
MKILTALVTALTLLGFSGAAFACDNMYRQENAAAKKAPLIPPTDEKTT